MTAVAWPEVRHIRTGLRGQWPRPMRLAGGRRVPGDSGGVRQRACCGYRGVDVGGQCPVCEVRPVVEAMWLVVCREWEQIQALRHPSPFVTQRRVVKQDRNAPCQCGSGRKAKKCCGV